MKRNYRNFLVPFLLLFCITSAQAQVFVKTGHHAVKKEVKSDEDENVSVQDPEYRVLGGSSREEDGKMFLDWSKAADVMRFRYDAGVLKDGLTLSNAGPRGILGLAFRDIRQLDRIFWSLFGFVPSDRKVNIYVFDLTEAGVPSKDMLYSAENVSCRSLEGNIHDLCTPLKTPRGCFVGFSSADDKSLSMAMDDGKDSEWPFVRGTNFFTTDYLNKDFVSGDDQGLYENLIIRCYGEKEGASSNSESYNVWRFKAGEESTPTAWTLLNAAPVQENSFEDTHFFSLPRGIYFYAVDVATETDPLRNVSCAVYRDMYTRVEFSVKSTLESFIPQGAIVTLEGLPDVVELPDYTMTVPEDGNVVFPSVLKGKYTLSILMDGFEPIREEVDLSAEDSYSLDAYILHEYLDEPWGLAVNKNAMPGKRTVIWNVNECITEDVEDHEAFAIHSPGKLGWSYIDEDKGKTYSINNCVFPNMNTPFAFIVFNPEETMPSLGSFSSAAPHSGRQYFAAFANLPVSEQAPAPDNNDWLISPKLEFQSGFVFDFWAKAFQAAYPESFRVYYSTEGKDTGDFVHELTAGEEVVGAQWTNYSYKVPQEATYVAINYVSSDKFIFMVDDLRFTEERSQAIPRAFEVSLDGGDPDTLDIPTVSFGNLSEGKHKVAVKSIYLTGTSAVVEKEFEVNDVNAGIRLFVKDESGTPIVRAKVVLNGEFTYETFTGTDGRVDMDGILGNAAYRLEISANGYKRFTKEVDLTEGVSDLGEVLLTDMPVKPGTVYAKPTEDAASVHISWRAPFDYILFRKDNGNIVGGLGSNMGTEKTVVGAAYPSETELYSIQWMTASQGRSEINLFVFDLDRNGVPVKNILYEKRNVENIGLQWNMLYLETPLHCPNGFMLGVSGCGFGNVGLGADSGKDSLWPFVPKTNYLINDYTADNQEFNLLDQNFTRNLMIRAEGSDGLSVKGRDSKAVIGYKVYRARLSDNGTDGEYFCLTEEPIQHTEFKDTAWHSLEKAYYRYAVRSVYPNGDFSEMAYSDKIGKNIFTRVCVSVLAGNQPADNAEVFLLQSSSQPIKAISDKNGVAEFQNVPTGIFNLRICKQGYADFEIYGMDFSSEVSYVVGPYSLTGELPAPTGLRVEETADWATRSVRWDVMDEEPEGDAHSSSFFLLDAGGKASFYLYEVYLDSMLLGETAETTYRIGNLTTGRHTVGVRTKNGYSYSPMSKSSFTVSNVAVESPAETDVRVFPNPVTDGCFTISCSGTRITSVRIMDLAGREVSLAVSGDEETKTVETGSLKGVMLLIIQTECGNVCKKLIIL